jgi:L-threonylcarbamoyladenylate synthase
MKHSTILEEKINHAAQIVKGGGVVAYPTDTFYGLGCNPFDERAVEKIFDIKRREGTKAILLLISSLESLATVVSPLAEDSLTARRFALLRERLWPGPLTIVLLARPSLPANLVSTARTIGVRYPDYSPAIDFIEAAGGVITATSANLSGHPPTQTAEQVEAQLGKSVDYILDLGPSPGGLPSTVIDLTIDPPALVREGAVSRPILESLLGKIQ